MLPQSRPDGACLLQEVFVYRRLPLCLNMPKSKLAFVGIIPRTISQFLLCYSAWLIQIHSMWKKFTRELLFRIKREVPVQVPFSGRVIPLAPNGWYTVLAWYVVPSLILTTQEKTTTPNCSVTVSTWATAISFQQWTCGRPKPWVKADKLRQIQIHFVSKKKKNSYNISEANENGSQSSFSGIKRSWTWNSQQQGGRVQLPPAGSWVVRDLRTGSAVHVRAA